MRCACTCVYTFACVYVHACAHVCLCTYVQCVYARVCAHVCSVSVHVCAVCLWTHAWVCERVHVCALCMCTCACSVYVHPCVYVHMCACIGEVSSLAFMFRIPCPPQWSCEHLFSSSLFLGPKSPGFLPFRYFHLSWTWQHSSGEYR